MKHNFFYVVFLSLLLFGVSSCQTKAQSAGVVDTHTARINIDWSGVYTGHIPSADGGGINVQLTLNSDETFLLRYQYMKGLDWVNSEFYYREGKFTWNETGNTIIMDTKDAPNYYRVRKGTLLQLDTKGNEITGINADYYVLKKE